jgi:hypothetical protein
MKNMRKKKYRITEGLYIKAVKKADRELEICFHCKPISYKKIHKSKKAYSRKIKHKQKEI